MKSLYLQEKLDWEMYMNQTRGFENAPNPNHIGKLRKALYGLKQAPSAWYGRLLDFLLKVVIELCTHTQVY